MNFAHIKTVFGVMALSVTFAGTAHAQLVLSDITYETSDSGNVDIGVSTVNGGPHSDGKIGIWVPNLPSSPSKWFVDFEGLQSASPPVGGVTSIHNPTGTITDHSQFGRFDFSKVSGQNVYYGEWSQTADATKGDHTVYYAGTDATDPGDVPTSGTANYTAYGLSDFLTNGRLSGTLHADFGAGELTGALESASYKVDIGTASISGAGFIGIDAEAFTKSGGVATSVAEDGLVSGNFFGADAEALAGIVTFDNNQYDTAFGGTN